MADSFSHESIEQAVERRGRIWPQTLISATAIDDLARDLYLQRMLYWGETPQKWHEVPFNIRNGFFELAKRSLDLLGPPAKSSVDRPLFDFASDLARSMERKPTRTVVTGLGGKIIGAINAPPEQCFYCSSEPIQEKHYPYCSVQCAISAAREDEEERDRR